MVEARKETAHEWNNKPGHEPRFDTNSSFAMRNNGGKRKPEYQVGNQGGQGRGAKKTKGAKGGSKGKNFATYCRGRKLCVTFQRGRCSFGRKCKDLHACSALLPGGDVCGDSNHAFVSHQRLLGTQSPKVPLEKKEAGGGTSNRAAVEGPDCSCRGHPGRWFWCANEFSTSEEQSLDPHAVPKAGGGHF